MTATTRELISATAGEWTLTGIVKADTACQCCTRRVRARAFQVNHPEYGELELGRRCAVRATGWKQPERGARIAARVAEVKRRQEVVGAAFPALAEGYQAEEERGRQEQAAGFEPRYPGHDVRGRRFYLFQLATTEDFLWHDEAAEQWRAFVVERQPAFESTAH